MSQSRHQDAHHSRDQEKLRLHHAVAREIERRPGAVISAAMLTLERWQAQGGVRPCYQEWQRILATHSPRQIVALITSDDARGRRLRQSTPFVGIVDRAERDSILGGP